MVPWLRSCDRSPHGQSRTICAVESRRRGGGRTCPPQEALAQWEAFDWSAVEDRIAAEDHVLVPGLDGVPVHFWRSGHEDAPALVLLHGWPDSFVRFRMVVPHLDELFRTWVPSLPGFGWSAWSSAVSGDPEWVARHLLEALDQAEVTRFGVYGGDLGTAIAEQMALLAPERVTGLNCSDVPMWRAAHTTDLTPAEARWVQDAQRWTAAEGAYAHQQRTRPQTLAYRLTDSPAALASWYLEKFQTWGAGDTFGRISPELFLENLSLHWSPGPRGPPRDTTRTVDARRPRGQPSRYEPGSGCSPTTSTTRRSPPLDDGGLSSSSLTSPAEDTSARWRTLKRWLPTSLRSTERDEGVREPIGHRDGQTPPGVSGVGAGVDGAVRSPAGRDGWSWAACGAMSGSSHRTQRAVSEWNGLLGWSCCRGRVCAAVCGQSAARLVR